MKYSTFWKINRSWNIQEISLILCKTIVHHLLHKSPLCSFPETCILNLFFPSVNLSNLLRTFEVKVPRSKIKCVWVQIMQKFNNYFFTWRKKFVILSWVQVVKNNRYKTNVAGCLRNGVWPVSKKKATLVHASMNHNADSNTLEVGGS